jgi:uncharacterized protein
MDENTGDEIMNVNQDADSDVLPDKHATSDNAVSDKSDGIINATLITGASSGIGLEFAKIFAREGHNLVLVARSVETLNTLKDSLEKEYDIVVKVLIYDLAHYDSPTRIYEEVRKSGMNVNILVNNAGFGTYGKFSETNLDTELDMIQVNITALTHLTKLFLKDMIADNNGRILNVASTAAFQPGPLMAVYYATKAYVLSFSEALAEELRDTKIKVTTLCPGPTATNFTKAAGTQNIKFFEKNKASDQDVAQYGYDSLINGKRVAIYGLRNKLLVQSTKLVPRKTVTRIVMNIQKKKKDR